MTHSWTGNGRRNLFGICVVAVGLLSLTGCNGIMDGIYDKADEAQSAAVKGQLLIDATSWTNWYYVDLDRLQQLTMEGNDSALKVAQSEFEAYPISMQALGDVVSGNDAHTAATEGERAGQYMYWFDVFGEGIAKNEFRSFTPTSAQPAPDSWSFAVHRNNVRTNGGAVLETTYTSMSQLPESSGAFTGMTFTEDEWSENEVWDSQEQMLMCLVPSQGIRINKVLSSWLAMSIPPVPPQYSLNNHVFILRLKNGKCAALQLENYVSPTGTKCWLTINYKYPY